MNYPVALVLSATIVCGTIVVTSLSNAQDQPTVPTSTVTQISAAGTDAWAITWDGVVLYCRTRGTADGYKVQCTDRNGPFKGAY